VSEETQATLNRNSPRWGRWLFFAVVLAVLVGIGVALVRLVPITHRYYTDADTIKAPATTAQTRDILWQPPKPLAEVINTTVDDYEPRISADGLTLFFVRGKAGENADIYVSKRTYEGWTEPEPLVTVNTEHEDLGPEPSADGQSLYFYSDRPGGLGGYDIWVTHRNRDGWQEPISVGPLVNSEFNDYGPAITPDGKTLYFSSNRPQPDDREKSDPNAWPAMIREDLFHRDYDLYAAAVTDHGFGEAETMTSLNSPYNEGAPAVSSFGDFLYFASDRPGGEGGFDLYRSRRLRGEHRPAENLGRPVNTKANELDPGLGLGGYALFFSSDTLHERTATETPREYNLYYTTSREVFSEIEHMQRPPINWAALWRVVGPNLLWALLAFLLLLLLLALMRDLRGRRLSLLAKCLLASLMAHLLLMLLFNVWEVTATLAREFRHGGRIRIALASPAAGDALARQIRGQLTDIETPTPLEMSHQRRDVPVEADATPTMAVLTLQRGSIDMPEDLTADLTAADAAIEQRIEPAVISEASPDTHVPTALEVALPTEQASIHAAEPDPSAHVAPVDLEPPARPSVAAAMSGPVEGAVDLAQIPPSYDNTEAPSDAPTLAAVSPGREADPKQSSVRDSTATLASLDYPAMTDLSLSQAPVDRMPETTETAPRITLRASASPRYDLPDSTLSQPPEGRILRIEPKMTGVISEDSTFAERPTAHAADVSPSPASRESRRAPWSDPALPPLTDFALAKLETASATPTTEQIPQPTVQTAVPPRRVLPANAIVEAEHETQVSIDPQQIDPTPDGSSLAAVPEPNTSGATPIRALRDISTTFHAKATLPPLAGLALPSLEQSSTAPQSETSPQVAWVTSNAPRASLAESLTSAEDSVPAVALDVPQSWHHQTEESPAHLVEPVTRDYGVERLALLSTTPLSARDLLIPDETALSLSLPTEEVPPANPYVQRSAPDRLTLVERMGGSDRTERAVTDALGWLARHQSKDGRWDGKHFDDQCGGCGGETDIVVNHALTGLALLCFYGAGHTHVSDGPYQENIERGLRWLIDRQKPNGDLRGEETMYTQGIVTITLSEAYGMTGDASLAEPVRLAVRFIDRARNTRVGGWRYDPGQVGDTSVLGWQVMALRSASLNGIATPAASFKTAREWLDLVSSSSRPGLYGYQPHRQYTPAMTAEGMFTQQLLGLSREDPRMQSSAAFISEHPPDWESTPNTYYWYYATLALFQHQGEQWRKWNDALTGQLLKHQRKDEPAAGSWDPDGEWADIGGRVYQTAMCTLMLEVYYRYLPLYSLDGSVDPIGAIRGFVSDASTGNALPGAAVRLVLPDRSAVSVTTGTDGGYSLQAPEVPDFFALSASMDGYIPSTANVDSAMILGTTLAVDFQLAPENLAMVAIEPVPDVHHLGDDNFDGRINSQFQKTSEGSRFVAQFELVDAQLPPHFNKAEVALLAKGVQRSHKILINGIVLDNRLDDAPSDGSFGEFIAPFDASLLRLGTNTFEIIARPSSSDIDDFEFVNVRIDLSP